MKNGDSQTNAIISQINKSFILPLAPEEVKDVMKKYFTNSKGENTFNFKSYKDRVKLGQRLIDKAYEKN